MTRSEPVSTLLRSRPEAALARIAGGVMLVVVAAALVVPRGAMNYLAILTLVVGALAVQRGWRLRDARWPTPAARGLLVLGGVAVASSLWAVAPVEAWKLGALFLLNVLLTVVACDLLWQEKGVRLARLGLGLVIGLLLGLTFQLEEILSRLWLHKLLYNTFPSQIPGNTDDYNVANGVVVSVASFMLNRQVAVAAMLLWPTLLVVSGVRDTAWRRTLWLGILALSCAVILLSQHESSKLALVCSLAAFAGAALSYRWSGRVVLAVWLIATLLIVPIAASMFHAKLYEQTWIQTSGRARIIMWGYTATLVAKAPVLGIGAGSAAVLDAKADHTNLPGQPWGLYTAGHQHNIYLQTWYELGLLGALVLCVTGVLGWRRIGTLPGGVRCYALATFVSVAGLCATSYGIWQPWLCASLGLAAVALSIAMRHAETSAFDLLREGVD